MIEVIKLVEPLWHSKAAAYIVQQKLNGRFLFVFPLTLCKGGVMRSVRHPSTCVVSTGHTVKMEQSNNYLVLVGHYGHGFLTALP